jgi:hypothetical protein
MGGIIGQVILMGVFVALALPVRAGIKVVNMTDGEAIRYPVALLHGVTNDQGEIQVVNKDNARPEGTNRTPIINDTFKILVELVPGVNRLRLKTATNQTTLTLIYRPMTTDRRVNVVYVTAKDGETRYITQKRSDRQNYREKIDVAVKLMQTFTAERLNDAGHGRKTFNLELDRRGKVVVHTVSYPSRAETLRNKSGYELYRLFYPWVDRQFPMTRNQNLVLMAFTAYDPKTRTPRGHTALGEAGMGLFSAHGLGAWPDSLRDVVRAFSDTTRVDDSRVWDDTAYRSTLWALASTTIGAMLHEMGHAFGLEDHSPDPNSIMSRGFDHFNRAFTVIEPTSAANARPNLVTDSQTPYWDPPLARRLAAHAWFQPDPEPHPDAPRKPGSP